MPGPGQYKLPSSLGYQVLAHQRSSRGVSFTRSPARVQVTPGVAPRGSGMLLPSTYKCDTTPGCIY